MSTPVFPIEQHHILQFTTNLQMALSKQPGKLVPYVTQASYSGEKAQVVKYLGEFEVYEYQDKLAQLQYTELEHTQRWLSPRRFAAATLISDDDQLYTLYDPTNPYVERMRQAFAKQQDRVVMQAFFGSARTGTQGLTTETFDTTAYRLPHGGTALTVDKLLAMRQIIKQNHVDLQSTPLYLAVTAQQITDLLGTTQVTSSDFNAIKTLQMGEVNSFAGFNFVPYEDDGDALEGRGIPQRTDGADTIRQLPVWVPKGMHIGMWRELSVSVDRIPERIMATQICGSAIYDACRLEPGHVYQLEVVE